MNIVLVGMMGSGKTTVARILGKMINYEIYDTDHLIEVEKGVSISQIFVYAGEEFFRKLETEVIKRFHKNQNIVLSTGGGILINEANLYILKALGKVVYLRTSTEVLASRLSSLVKARPLLKRGDQTLETTVSQILKQRQKNYERADFILDTDLLSAHEVAHKVRQKFNL